MSRVRHFAEGQGSFGFALWYFVAIAAFALIGVAVWWTLSARPDKSPTAVASTVTIPDPQPIVIPSVESAENVAQPPAPAISQMERAFNAAQTPKEAFDLLKAAYNAKKARMDIPDQEYHEIINLAQKLKERWPVTCEACDGIQLSSRCWTRLGEPQKARESYVAYAEYKGELEKTNTLAGGKSIEEAEVVFADNVSRELMSEANGLFNQKEYVQALSYCDLVMTRFPKHERSMEALQMFARYAVSQKQYDEAVLAYERILEQSPDSRFGRLAKEALPRVLIGAGRISEASQRLMSYSQETQTDAEAARFTCRAAQALATGNEKERQEALRLYEQVITKYPNEQRWVSMAKKALERAGMTPTQRDLDAAIDPVDVLK